MVCVRNHRLSEIFINRVCLLPCRHEYESSVPGARASRTSSHRRTTKHVGLTGYRNLNAEAWDKHLFNLFYSSDFLKPSIKWHIYLVVYAFSSMDLTPSPWQFTAKELLALHSPSSLRLAFGLKRDYTDAGSRIRKISDPIHLP